MHKIWSVFRCPVFVIIILLGLICSYGTCETMQNKYPAVFISHNDNMDVTNYYIHSVALVSPASAENSFLRKDASTDDPSDSEADDSDAPDDSDDNPSNDYTDDTLVISNGDEDLTEPIDGGGNNDQDTLIFDVGNENEISVGEISNFASIQVNSGIIKSTNSMNVGEIIIDGTPESTDDVTTDDVTTDPDNPVTLDISGSRSHYTLTGKGLQVLDGILITDINAVIEGDLTIDVAHGIVMGDIQLGSTTVDTVTLQGDLIEEATFENNLCGGDSTADIFSVNLEEITDTLNVTGKLMQIDTYNFNMGTVNLSSDITDASLINIAPDAILNVTGARNITLSSALNVDGAFMTDASTTLTGVININTTTGHMDGEVQLGTFDNILNFTGDASDEGGEFDAIIGGEGNDTINITLSEPDNVLENNGIINLGGGEDVINLQEGTFRMLNDITLESVLLGAGGTAMLDLEAGTFTGNISGEPNDNPKTVTIGGGVVNGDINFVQGIGNTVYIDASRGVMNGTLTGSSGSDTLSVLAGNFMTHAEISGFESIDLTSGSMTVSGENPVNGVDTALILGAGQSLTLQDSLSGTGTFTFNGELEINLGSTLALNNMSSPAGEQSVYKIHIGTGNDNGSRLELARGGADLTNTTASIIIDNENFIEDGTTYTIVDGNAISTIPIGELVENFFMYDFNIDQDETGNDLILSVHRVNSYDSVASNETNAAIGSSLENIGSQAEGELLAIQQQLSKMSDAQGMNDALETILPESNGLAVASMMSLNSAMNAVGTRMMAYREGALNGIWMQGFNATLKQDMVNDIQGFEADCNGVSVGIDAEALVGIALSYARGKLESDANNNASTTIDSFQLIGYANKDMDIFFLESILVGGMNFYNTDRHLDVGTLQLTAEGEYKGMQLGAHVAAGRHFEVLPNIILTPRLGLKYTYLNVEDYTETGAGSANLNVTPEPVQVLACSFGTAAAGTFAPSEGFTIVPELYAGYSFDAIRDTFGTTSAFADVQDEEGQGFTVKGIEIDESAFNLGGGIALVSDSGLEFRLDYGAEVRSDYMEQKAQLMLRWEF